MKYLLILIFLVFCQSHIFCQSGEKGKNGVTSLTDSLDFVKLKKEVDSLSLVFRKLEDILKYSDSIRTQREKVNIKKSDLKSIKENLKIEENKISKIDTTRLNKELKTLRQNDDSIKVSVLLESNQFNKNLRMANSKDDFCVGAQNFIQNFIPELYLYYFKSGKYENLDTNKNKTITLFDVTHQGSNNKDFYKNIIDKTFLSAKTLKEFYTYLDVLMSVDISKCD